MTKGSFCAIIQVGDNMKKVLTTLLLSTGILLLTGCSKLYTYDRVVRESKNKIARDIVIENPGSINRDNGLKAYTAYLERDKYKKITIINGKDTLLPFGQNYLCTDFAEVYLVSKFNEYKNRNSFNYNILSNMNVEPVSSALHPKCKNLKITIDCNEREQYMKVLNDFILRLKREGIYLNETGVNRYEIACQNGQNNY